MSNTQHTIIPARIGELKGRITSSGKQDHMNLDLKGDLLVPGERWRLSWLQAMDVFFLVRDPNGGIVKADGVLTTVWRGNVSNPGKIGLTTIPYYSIQKDAYVVNVEELAADAHEDYEYPLPKAM